MSTNVSMADSLRLATTAPEATWRGDHDRALEMFPRSAVNSRCWRFPPGVFAARPTALFVDEPSLGLAPMFLATDRFRQTGITVLIVEQQYVERALAVAATTTVLAKGEAAWHGAADGADQRAVAARCLGGQPAR